MMLRSASLWAAIFSGFLIIGMWISDILFALSIVYLILGLAVYAYLLVMPIVFIGKVLHAIAGTRLRLARSNNPCDTNR